jgi:hypothetical protein
MEPDRVEGRVDDLVRLACDDGRGHVDVAVVACEFACRVIDHREFFRAGSDLRGAERQFQREPGPEIFRHRQGREHLREIARGARRRTRKGATVWRSTSPATGDAGTESAATPLRACGK